MNTPAVHALLLLAVTVPLAAGCGALAAASAPGDARFFSIERTQSHPGSAPTEAHAAAPEGPTRLRLGRVTGAPHLEERVVYRDSAHEIGYYREVRWSEPPEQFLERQLSRALFEERGIRHVVGGAETTLAVRLTAFDEIRFPPVHLARAKAVVRLHDEHLVLWEETLTVEQPIAWEEDGDLAVAAVEAFQEVMQALVDRIADRVVDVLEAQR